MLCRRRARVQQLRQQTPGCGCRKRRPRCGRARVSFSPSRWPMQPPTATMRFSKGEPARRGDVLAWTPPARRACVSAASRTQQVMKTTMSAVLDGPRSDRRAQPFQHAGRCARSRACSSGIRTCGRRRSVSVNARCAWRYPQRSANVERRSGLGRGRRHACSAARRRSGWRCGTRRRSRCPRTRERSTISMPMGERNPREMAMALTAWFTAPAPTAWISTAHAVLHHAGDGARHAKPATTWRKP